MHGKLHVMKSFGYETHCLLDSLYVLLIRDINYVTFYPEID
jgi:hypothetical protein